MKRYRKNLLGPAVSRPLPSLQGFLRVPSTTNYLGIPPPVPFICNINDVHTDDFSRINTGREVTKGTVFTVDKLRMLLTNKRRRGIRVGLYRIPLLRPLHMLVLFRLPTW